MAIKRLTHMSVGRPSLLILSLIAFCVWLTVPRIPDLRSSSAWLLKDAGSRIETEGLFGKNFLVEDIGKANHAPQIQAPFRGFWGADWGFGYLNKIGRIMRRSLFV